MPRSVRDSAQLFAALGDEMRLQLVARLSSGESLSISSLTAGSKITRQSITKHLRVMQGSGLVSCIQQGRERHYKLERHRIAEAERYLGLISKQWDTALERLRSHVER